MMRWLERNWESLCMEALSTALQWERMYKGLSRTIFRRFSSSRTTSQLSFPVSVLTFLFRREPFRSKTCKWRMALLLFFFLQFSVRLKTPTCLSAALEQASQQSNSCLLSREKDNANSIFIQRKK